MWGLLLKMNVQHMERSEVIVGFVLIDFINSNKWMTFMKNFSVSCDMSWSNKSDFKVHVNIDLILIFNRI